MLVNDNVVAFRSARSHPKPTRSLGPLLNPKPSQHEERPVPTSVVRRLDAGGGRTLTATPIFETYWRFAYARQEAFFRRLEGAASPWTDDPIIARHRFTNVYRAADRVSQYLIRHVIYSGAQSDEEVFFRTVLFKLFNKIETWENLTASVGDLSWKKFRLQALERALDDLFDRGGRVYSAAYIMPSPNFGCVRKHANHLRLLEHMMRDGAPRKVARARSLEEVFLLLRAYPSLGDFLAFQLAIDLNYGSLINFSEMDFVVAGPGARSGLRKCFADTDGMSDAEVIGVVARIADAEFTRLGLAFRNLWGRPLQLIDCQNVFCEVDKYARVAHPTAAEGSGRTRIKQRYEATLRNTTQWYPPKWNVHPPDGLGLVAPAIAAEE